MSSAALSTSVTHADGAYLGVCARAAVEDRIFSIFKSLPEYRRVLEHVSYEQGLAYLRELDPSVAEMLASDLRANDLHGSPSTYEYPGVGILSPTTLRYAKVACDVRRMFHGVRRIVEIGAGYGGQRFVLSKVLASVDAYTIVDLPPVLALIDRYLRTLDCRPYTLVDALDDAAVCAIPATDLVISNYALSECTSEVRGRYLATILRRSTYGYMTLNMDPMSTEEMRATLAADREVTLLDEKPLTGPNNCIMTYRPRTEPS